MIQHQGGYGMKATGIVRRIDDLGRVVIPKEIRRTQCIRVGDPLEIFVTAKGEVVFKKYSAMGESSENARLMCEVLYKALGRAVVVTDCDHVIAQSGAKELADMRISPAFERVCTARRLYTAQGSPAPLDVQNTAFVSGAMPILSGGDLIGAVALPGRDACGDREALLLRVAAGFLGRQLEE